MNTREIAAKLRESADLIERREPPSMVPNISHRQAHELLMEGLPGSYCLSSKSWYHAHVPHEPPTVEWEVYDHAANKQHTSKSLSTVVAMALNTHAPSPNVESVDAALWCPSDVGDGARRELVEATL